MVNGFVALLDVLGFSALIQGDHDGRLTDYLGTLETAFEIGGESPGLEYIVFSDSIIVTTGDDSDASLESCTALDSVHLEELGPGRARLPRVEGSLRWKVGLRTQERRRAQRSGIPCG
jgi:hypothetical protein